MNPIQQAIANRNKKIVIGVSVVFAGLWILLVMYVLAESKKVDTTVNPGTITLRPNVPESNISTIRYQAPRAASTSLPRHSVNATKSKSALPQATMGTTSMHLYQTSSASVKSVGGEGNGGNGNAGNNSNSSKGIRYTAMAYSGAIYMPMNYNAVTTVGATQASEAVNEPMRAARRRMRQDTPDGELPGNYNGDPTPDPEEPESPVGDVAWGLMALLAGAYGYHLFRRNKPQTKQANI
jgi:hypothetical protein